jgi:NAD(P)H-hydrate epimerase
MEKIDIDDIRALDENAEFFGISRIQLMENAGKGVVDSILKRMNVKGKRVLIVAHTGNKGGDGFVAARHLLYHGAIVDVILLSKPENISTEEAKRNYSILEKFIKIYCTNDLINLKELFENADIIIDAMLGTGARGEPKEPIRTAIELCNKSKAFKVAIDIPTGIDPITGNPSKSTFKADLTVTHHKLKSCLLSEEAKSFVGDIDVISIGIPHELELFVGPGDLKLAYKPRDIFSHKGENGRVLVVGGSHRYSGAPALAALAALRIGIDLSIIAVPYYIANAIRSYSPDLIVQPLPSRYILDMDSIELLKEEAKKVDAIVIGMGLGTDDATIITVREFIKYLNEIGKPIVIDADAIKALSGYEISFNKVVLTPHAGEFYILTKEKLPEEKDDGWKKRIEIVKKWAKKLNAVIILKAHYDIITDGNRVKIKTIGNPGMTVGGTGDVLAGMIGGLLSKGIEPFRATVAASFLNSYIGDLLASEIGYHYTARDIINKIPEVLKKFGV